MVRAGEAARAYRDAPRAVEQVVRGIGPDRPVPGAHLRAVSGPGPGVVARLVDGLRGFLNPAVDLFYRATPLGQPAKLTHTSEDPFQEYDVRIDRFLWLDLDEPRTIIDSPVNSFIQDNIDSSRSTGEHADRFNHDNYGLYVANYDREYGTADIETVASPADAKDNPDERFTEVGIQEPGMRQTRPMMKRRSTYMENPTQKRRRKCLPAKLTEDEWRRREQSFQNHLWSINHFYDIIPPNTIYIAQDRKGANILIVHPSGIELAYGRRNAEKIVDDISYNIREYARSQPPPAVHDIRHIHHREWVQENPHLQGEEGRCGVYHWGAWTETGKDDRVVPTKETLKGGTRSNPCDGAHAFAYRASVMKSLGPLTYAVDILFRTVDRKLRGAYQRSFQQLHPGENIFFTTEKKSEELFPLRAILVNTLTEPHIDRDDWLGGWAWIAPFGSFSKGDLCLPQLGIRVPLPRGAIAGLRGRELVHFTDKWIGLRYSVVHFFKESIRRCIWKRQSAAAALTTTSPNQTLQLATVRPLEEKLKTPKRRARERRYRRNRALRIKSMAGHREHETCDERIEVRSFFFCSGLNIREC
ncbi:hypothetical protein GP486_007454 [Trichoglossum hirsutum]|uniref:Uncharacterized protein n=1 Tax=Trichoglossum hirsutum TaxID=265104 RepID=A0A9P8IHI5_9PEZI|nr:hypothetical protein GP486_007454 [Trichoglossum hirsutum]